MSRPVRAVTIAALSLCAMFAGYSVPSFADDRVVPQLTLASLGAANPYSLRTPTVLTTELPASSQTITPPTPSDDTGSAAAQDDATPKATTLAALVAQNEDHEIDSREEECLAGAVYFEAKSESLEGQLAVAEVIKNRAKSGRFPASYCKVVFQKSQFSFVRGGGFPPINKAGAAWRRAIAVARIASKGLWESAASKALFFHASHVAPGWRNLTRISRIGNHIFYR